MSQIFKEIPSLSFQVSWTHKFMTEVRNILGEALGFLSIKDSLVYMYYTINQNFMVNICTFQDSFGLVIAPFSSIAHDVGHKRIFSSYYHNRNVPRVMPYPMSYPKSFEDQLEDQLKDQQKLSKSYNDHDSLRNLMATMTDDEIIDEVSHNHI